MSRLNCQRALRVMEVQHSMEEGKKEKKSQQLLSNVHSSNSLLFMSMVCAQYFFSFFKLCRDVSEHENTRREVSLVLSWSVFWHYCTGGSISRCQDDNTESIHSRLRGLSFQISRAALHLQQNSCHITSLDYVWLTRNGICMNS